MKNDTPISTRFGNGPLLSLWLFAFLLGAFYAFAYIGESLLTSDYWVYASIVLGLLFTLLLFAAPSRYALRVDTERLVALLLGTNIFVNLYLRVDPGYLSLAWLPILFFLLRRTRVALVVLPATWLGLCSYLVADAPGYLVEGSGADMLAMIKAGSEAFLEGQNPHGMHFDEITTYPFMYVPALWLPYVPLVAFDLDMRLLNLLVLAIIATWAIIRFLKSGDAFAMATLLVLSSPLISLLVVKGQVWPYWLLCWLFGLAAARGAVLVAACLLGLTLAARQWAVFFLVGFPFYLLRAHGWSQTWRAGLLTVGVFLLVTLPFFVWDSSLFNVTYLEPMKEVHHNFTEQFSMTTILGRFGALDLKSIVFGAVLVLGASWVTLARSDAEAVWRAGLVFVAAVALNSKVHPYYYIPGLLVSASALPRYVREWRVLAMPGRQEGGELGGRSE